MRKGTKRIYNYLKIDKRNITQEIRLKIINEARNYFVEETE